ncbi:MAG: hypothetical protein QM765_24925 [Myxococcales bacterium]
MSSVPAQAMDASSGVAQRGKEQVRRYGGLAREQAFRQADRRKGALASALENFAFTLGETGDSLERRGLSSQRKVTDQVAGRLRQFSRQLRESSSQDLAAVAGEQFRKRPGSVLAACFALGFLGSRLLKP